MESQGDAPSPIQGPRTADDSEPPDRAGWSSQSLWGLLRDEKLLAAAPLLGGAFYVIGWAAAARFYGRFGVGPEEVGIDFGFMLVRVVGLLGISALIAVLVGRIQQINFDDDKSAERFHNRSMLISFVALTAAVWWLSPWEEHAGLSAVLFTGLYIVAAFIVWGIIFDRTAALTGYKKDLEGVYKYLPNQIHLGRWALLLAGVLLSVLVLGVMFVTDRVADTVESGQPAHIWALPFVEGFRVDDVQITRHDARTPDGTCLLLLGINDSVVVLYNPDQHQTLRLPLESTDLASPCPTPEPST